MRGAVRRIFIAVAAFALFACSSRSVETELTRCSYPDSPRTPAPSFICDPQIPGFPVTVLRSSEPSETSVSERIAQVFDDQVNTWANDWALQWFDDESQRDDAKTFLEIWLQDNGRVVRSRTSPKSYLWLLVGLPIQVQDLEQLTRDAVDVE